VVVTLDHYSVDYDDDEDSDYDDDEDSDSDDEGSDV